MAKHVALVHYHLTHAKVYLHLHIQVVEQQIEKLVYVHLAIILIHQLVHVKQQLVIIQSVITVICVVIK
jgi:hypothetical protein